MKDVLPQISFSINEAVNILTHEPYLSHTIPHFSPGNSLSDQEIFIGHHCHFLFFYLPSSLCSFLLKFLSTELQIPRIYLQQRQRKGKEKPLNTQLRPANRVSSVSFSSLLRRYENKQYSYGFSCSSLHFSSPTYQFIPEFVLSCIVINPKDRLKIRRKK